MKIKILIGIVAVLIGIQFITIDKTNPQVDMGKDFINLKTPPTELGNLIKSACYDCHSHHTKYPWYSDVAPISWLLKSHITDGREHLNFSTWGDYNTKRQDHKLEESIEMLRKDEMPLKAYVLLHEEAEINHEQKMLLISWLTELRDSL